MKIHYVADEETPERRIVRWDDPYVHQFWLPEIGPTTYLLGGLLARIERSGASTFADELVGSRIGVGVPQLERAVRRGRQLGLWCHDGDAITFYARLCTVPWRLISARGDAHIDAHNRWISTWRTMAMIDRKWESDQRAS